MHSRLDLSHELREALLDHTVCCVRFRPEFLASVEFDLLLFGDYDHAGGRDGSAGSHPGHSCTFFSLACRRRKPLEFELYFVQLGCLSLEAQWPSSRDLRLEIMVDSSAPVSVEKFETNAKKNNSAGVKTPLHKKVNDQKIILQMNWQNFGQ